MSGPKEQNLIKSLYKKISDLEQRLTHLNERNFQLKNLIDNLPGDIYWKDMEGRWSGLNKHCLDSLKNMGFIKTADEDEILGKTDHDIFSKATADEYRQNDLTIINDQVEISLEERTILPNGSEVILHSIKRPFYKSNDKVAGVIGNTIDITYLKKIEKELNEAKDKAEEASLAKTKFIANMSHDIRTPLTGIVGLSEILIDSAVKPESRDYAKMLNLSSEQLLSLLNSILEIAATNNLDDNQANISSFSIYELLRNLFELQLPALKLKGIQLKLKTDDNLPSHIETDKGKLYRILLNLLSNSIKFTDKGIITVELSSSKIKANKAQVIFTITDTGIGIPKSDMDKIFHAFYRVHPSYEGTYKGHGVGLHLVKQFVDLLQGDIDVKSIEGMGTQFKLSLPINISEKSKDSSSLALADQLQSVIKSINEPNIEAAVHESQIKYEPSKPINNNLITVLIVEDNPMAMKVADIMLKQKGFETKRAYTGEEALKHLDEYSIDLIISDIGLPDFSGFELARKIKEKNINTPIIGLTAHAKQEALVEGRQCGMNEVYEKPMTAEIINNLMTNFQGSQASEIDECIPKDSHPLFDAELGISQLSSADDLKVMVNIMLNESMINIANEIDENYQNKDWQAFKKSVHKFKSSCLYCATTQLLKYIHELEALSDTKRKRDIAPVYERFKICLEDTRKALENWLKDNH